MSFLPLSTTCSRSVMNEVMKECGRFLFFLSPLKAEGGVCWIPHLAPERSKEKKRTK